MSEINEVVNAVEAVEKIEGALNAVPVLGPKEKAIVAGGAGLCMGVGYLLGRTRPVKHLLDKWQADKAMKANGPKKESKLKNLFKKKTEEGDNTNNVDENPKA